MFQLDTEFYRLPLAFDPERLAAEVLQFEEHEWRAHPQGHAGNTALPLVSVGGGMNDEVKGPMRPTPFLERCPYIRQIFASLGTVIGRARLMRIAGQADATEHVDTNYYWMHHVRVHIPAVTYPQVEFQCNRRAVHMAAGETWIFDSWKPHNVLNPVDSPRIHLVADTVGSARFWDLVDRAHRPCDPARPASEAARFVAYRPGAVAAIDFEEENYPLVMSPWEQEALAARMLGSLSHDSQATPPVMRLRAALQRLHQQWHALWTRFGVPAEGLQAFAATIADFDRALPELAGQLALVNGVQLIDALRQGIVRPAINPEVAERRRTRGDSAPVASSPTRPAPASSVKPHITRPVIIVAAPRSGSSLLFELLSRSPDAWTIGGESHALIEGIQSLRPPNRGWDSNRLTADDATPAVVAQLHTSFLSQLRDRSGRPLPHSMREVRLLEKTPKNALRIPFLLRAFPDALFIYLTRDPRENISSMMEAWRSGGFATYPHLPGWTGTPWSLLLVPGWREMIGRPLAEIATRQWATANEVLLDDLKSLPRDRWTAVSYADVVRSPQEVAESLCAFADLGWDQNIADPLPLSRHTVSPPAPEKWRKNEGAISPYLPLAEKVATRAEEILRTQSALLAHMVHPL